LFDADQLLDWEIGFFLEGRNGARKLREKLAWVVGLYGLRFVPLRLQMSRQSRIVRKPLWG
jgi:hypothetical protein